MEKAGKEAETAEGEIYERVDGAEAGFDPDCGVVSAWFFEMEKAEVITRVARLTRKRWEENGDKAKEYIGRTHFRNSVMYMRSIVEFSYEICAFKMVICGCKLLPFR